MLTTLLVVLPAPTVVLWESSNGEIACRYSVPVEITELVPEVLPEISKAEMTVCDDCGVCE